MKTLLAMFIAFCFSANAFAEPSDYHCTVNQYDVNVSFAEEPTSTLFWMSRDYQTLAQGYAEFVEQQGDVTLFHFFPITGETVLTFKTADVDAQPEQLVGMIDTTADGYPLFDRLNCQKQN